MSPGNKYLPRPSMRTAFSGITTVSPGANTALICSPTTTTVRSDCIWVDVESKTLQCSIASDGSSAEWALEHITIIAATGTLQNRKSRGLVLNESVMIQPQRSRVCQNADRFTIPALSASAATSAHILTSYFLFS